MVERSTRFTMLLHLPRLAGWGVEARVKNGPALAGHGAVAMRVGDRRSDDHHARSAAALTDLGSRQGTRPARPAWHASMRAALIYQHATSKRDRETAAAIDARIGRGDDS